MKLRFRMLALAICLCALLTPVGSAEVADWADSQTSSQFEELRIQNQREALGVEVNTAVKAKDITGRCSIKVSTGDKSRLTNGTVSKGWSYSGSNAWIGVSLPSDVVPGALRMEFRFEPKGYEVEEYDADKNVIRTRTLADTFPSIYTMLALLPETRMIRIRMTAPEQVVVNLVLYSEGVLPNDVQTWLPPVEKADMMVFSTHQDDEVIFLGGTIPYADVVCARPTQTVYMTNCSRPRRREALECLWVMGSRHYPEFLNLKDKRVSTINEGIDLWGGKDNILKEMVARIRRYKPEVIVTQDFNGEYGHNQHKIMARAMPYAIEAAADPSRYPESYKRYGAWQVKKLYIHLYKENEIRMDWLTPQPALGGLTLLKVAQNGMAKHASQLKYYSVKNGGKYDNARFGLYMTTVGQDVARDDFFENIPADASSKYLEEHADEIAAAKAYVEETPQVVQDSGEDEDDAAEAGPLFDQEAHEAGTAVNDTDDGEDVDFGTLSGDTTALDASAEADTEAVDAVTVDAVADGNEVPEAGRSEPVVPAPEKERGGGSTAVAIAMIAAGVAAAGGGAWYLLRMSRRRRRGRGRARTGLRLNLPARGGGGSGRHMTKR